jgi:hypothetical protein
MQNMNWIKNLKQVNTEDLMDESILLFSILGEVQLNETNDTIQWKWTASGGYSAASAYDIQFLGAYPRFKASSVWRAQAEPKCRFFAWLALQRKAPAADNLMKKNWPCDPSCALCYCELETTDYLLTECNFAEAVWDRVAQEFQVHLAVAPFQKGSILSWMEVVNRVPSKRQQRICAGIIFFFWWFLWKERSQRIFVHKRVPISEYWSRSRRQLLTSEECIRLNVLLLYSLLFSLVGRRASSFWPGRFPSCGLLCG